MTTRDPNELLEWLYLEPDETLTSAERAELERAVSADTELLAERQQVGRLSELLESARVEVREDFHEQVMSSLPPASWSARHPRSWMAAGIVLFLLGGASALLTGLTAAQVDPVSPFVGAMAAIGDMLASSVRAGAGLLGASWKGVGLAIGEWARASAANTVSFVVLVVGANWMLVRRLRKRLRPQAVQESSSPARPDDSVE